MGINKFQVTCTKCNRRLTPHETGYYSAGNAPRCNSCRQVRRRWSESRRQETYQEVIKDISPSSSHYTISGSFSQSIRQAINATKDESWVSFFLSLNYFDNTILDCYNSWTILDDTVTYRSRKNERYVRQRIARFARKYVHPTIVDNFLTDQDFEIFNNLMTARFTAPKYTWKILTGEHIRNAYLTTSYSTVQNIGNMSDSCMKYEGCQPFLDIYVNNPEVCRLLTVWDDEEGKMVGRALLWKATSGTILMDRIYASDVVQQMFRAYASENNIEVLNRDYDSKEQVQLSQWMFPQYPYMDNFLYLNIDKGILACVITKNMEKIASLYFVLRYTEGQHNTQAYLTRYVNTQCHECSNYYPVPTREYSKYYTSLTASTNDTNCPYCTSMTVPTEKGEIVLV